MTDSPFLVKPRWAASIWIAGDWLCLELPSVEGGVKAHTIKVPNTQAGLERLLPLLRNRNSNTKLFTKGDSTQAMLDAVEESKGKVVVKRPKAPFVPEFAASARDVLRKLGMI